MTSRFELFIAGRYLRARRKEAVISVITLISVLGVAAGVMALVIALAVTNGFQNTLQRNLLGAMAHINVMEKEPGYGIEDWRDMAAKLRKLPHVTEVSPALYSPALLTGGLQPKCVILKGIDVNAEMAVSESLRLLKAGSLDRLRDPAADPPGIVLGSDIVEDTGMIAELAHPRAFSERRADALRSQVRRAPLPRRRRLLDPASTRSTTTGRMPPCRRCRRRSPCRTW